ncbi:MAG: YabP/YqfC family sporulation protein [Bacillota bacterium]
MARRPVKSRKRQAKPWKPSRWKRALLGALDLPVETEPTVPKLTMVGRGDLLVENHKGVLQYDKSNVRLLTHEGVLHITGENLELLELAVGRAYVRGRLAGALYTD